MTEAVITALITGVLTLVGSCIANSKTKSVILYRLDEIEKKQDRVNSMIERTYRLEQSCAVLENRQKVSEHRIDDIERGVNKWAALN